MPDNNTTTLSVIVTDQGNGGTYCTACGKDIGYLIAVECPHCHRKVIAVSDYINYGGSDF